MDWVPDTGHRLESGPLACGVSYCSKWGLSNSDWNELESLTSSCRGWKRVCAPKFCCRKDFVSELSEGFCMGCWHRAIGHSLCACCQLMGADKCLSLTQTSWVCTSVWACAWRASSQTLSWTPGQVRDIKVWTRVVGQHGLHVLQRTWEFASKPGAGPAGESGTVKQVRTQDLGRCARQAESMGVLAGPLCLCVLENLEGVREKGGREESGAVLLISLRAINFITPNDTIITVLKILSTLQNFGISKYHWRCSFWTIWSRQIIKLSKLSTLESISCYFELTFREVLTVIKHSRWWRGGGGLKKYGQQYFLSGTKRALHFSEASFLVLCGIQLMFPLGPAQQEVQVPGNICFKH